jgi:hypothetical protein
MSKGQSILAEVTAAPSEAAAGTCDNHAKQRAKR